MPASSGLAQDAKAAVPTLPKVTWTGSLIERIADEKPLPVTSITQNDIRASGATSVVDLVRRITSTQGATGESASVGGESFGFSGISIHNLGESRTLVLLNGRRLAQFGGQNATGFAAAFDLNALPISAIEEIQILTDGASSIYGADAIGGVVNIITKHATTDGDVTIGFSSPQGGAHEKRLSATKGFGAPLQDGYNVMLSFGHDERNPLAATSRSFARTGQRDFSYQGQQYRIQNLSPYATPATALDDSFQYLSPFRVLNGGCPPSTSRVVAPYVDPFGVPLVDDYCGHDFVRDLEIYPERKRDNFMASATVGQATQHQFFADVLLSRTRQVSRIAGVPGDISIPAGGALHDQYLLPSGITMDSLAFYRLPELGRRTSSDTAEFANLVLGSRGKLLDWDYELGYSRSQSTVKSRIAGYIGQYALQNLVDNGLVDPFVGPGQQSPAGVAALAGAAYNGYWNGGIAKLDSLGLNGKREFGALPGGPVSLATGIHLSREYFASRPGLFAQGRLFDPAAGTLCDPTLAECLRFGDSTASVPYSASRTSSVLFGELLMPVTRTLDVGASARLDHYSDFGNASTGKASFKWLPAEKMLVRGSIGTGFHAPTVPQVKAPRQSGGFTSGVYDCTPELQAVATAQGAACQAGSAQYDVLFAGNTALQAEKSRQASLGFRLEPTQSLSVGADLWHVQIANRIGQLSEQFAFANPGAFPNSWSSVGGNLAFLQDNQNLGKSYATGIDVDVTARTQIAGVGDLTSNLTLTQMLREAAQLQKGGRYYSAIGNFAELGTVTFRTQGRLSMSLKTSDRWTHGLAVNFKSGYRDQLTTVDVVDAVGNVTGQEDIRVHVKSYSTVDWQTQWTSPGKENKWTIAAGILNLFNRSPPFAVSSSGLDRGSQYGYDDRYYDPRGRVLYVNGNYKF